MVPRIHHMYVDGHHPPVGILAGRFAFSVINIRSIMAIHSVSSDRAVKGGFW